MKKVRVVDLLNYLSSHAGEKDMNDVPLMPEMEAIRKEKEHKEKEKKDAPKP